MEEQELQRSLGDSTASLKQNEILEHWTKKHHSGYWIYNSNAQ